MNIIHQLQHYVILFLNFIILIIALFQIHAENRL